MKHRQAKKDAKKLAAMPFGGRKDLRVSYRNCTAKVLRGTTQTAGIIDDAWHPTNVKRVPFPEPYDGPLYNPPIEDMPVPGKHYDDLAALNKEQHPETWVTMKDGKEVHRVTIENPGPYLPIIKWMAETQPMTRGVEPGPIMYTDPSDPRNMTPVEMEANVQDVLQGVAVHAALVSATVAELQKIAKEMGIKGPVSTMKKSDLIEAIRAKRVESIAIESEARVREALKGFIGVDLATGKDKTGYVVVDENGHVSVIEEPK